MKDYRRFNVLQSSLLGLVCLALLFTIALSVVRSQDVPATPSAALFRNKDSLVIYVQTAAKISVRLRDIQFNLQPANKTVRYDRFEASFGLNFDRLAGPACLRLLRENTEAPYPSDCTSGPVRRYSVNVTNADVFWYDQENGRNFTLNIIGAGGAAFECPTSQVDCTFNVPLAEENTTAATALRNATPLLSGNSIIFVRNDDLFIIDRNGKNERRVSASPTLKENYPSWSHSGELIAYRAISNGESNGKIYRMNADGSGNIRLTSGSSADYNPVFSPDDQKIVYRSVVNNIGNIWVMNVDGSNQINLTNSKSIDYTYPDWSPDGKHIVVSANVTGKYEIWTMGADGQNQQQITFNSAGSYAPTWSPDGQYIAFQSDVNGAGYDLSVIKLGSGDQFGNRITSNPSLYNRQPHWSPDGQFIVYAAKINSANYGLFIINREGKGDPNPIAVGWQPWWGR